MAYKPPKKQWQKRSRNHASSHLIDDKHIPMARYHKLDVLWYNVVNTMTY